MMSLKILILAIFVFSSAFSATLENKEEVVKGEEVVKEEEVKVVEVEAMPPLTSSSSSPKQEYPYDRTSDLMGMIAYVECLYYPLWWIVPWNYGLPHYTGTINDLMEEQVYDPYEKTQLRFFDCGGGYACIESAYNRYYFGLAEMDYSVNFYEEETDMPTHEAYKFKIYCESTALYNFEKCNFVVTAYGGHTYQIYPTGLSRLDYCENCGSNDWFRWRIKATKPTDYMDTDQSALCNTGTTTIEQVFTHKIGIEVTDGDWNYESIIGEEVQLGMTYAARRSMLTQNSMWLTLVGNQTYTAAAIVPDSTATLIPPRTRVVFQQLRAKYGPYTVYSNVINKSTQTC